MKKYFDRFFEDFYICIIKPRIWKTETVRSGVPKTKQLWEKWKINLFKFNITYYFKKQANFGVKKNKIYIKFIKNLLFDRRCHFAR